MSFVLHTPKKPHATRKLPETAGATLTVVPPPEPAADQKRTRENGPGYWMLEVLREHRKARHHLRPNSLHDLRVALRRFSSMADGLAELDPAPEWKEARRESKRLLKGLGELRDNQVMMDWVLQFHTPDDALGKALLDQLRAADWRAGDRARKAMRKFDRKAWKSWSRILPERVKKIPRGSLPFQAIALDRWKEGHNLHRRAMHTRSKTALHRLRVGLKQFRYTVENFLPHHHRQWGPDLKELQDALGDVHDLDVLWGRVHRMSRLCSPEDRVRWKQIIERTRRDRFDIYRRKMLGRNSLWVQWRSGLPGETHTATLARLSTWASFLDPDFAHSEHVLDLALELYDGLVAGGIIPSSEGSPSRALLCAAALMHNVGLAQHERGHHKTSARMIRKLSPPFDWTDKDIEVTALVARYHRGALPSPRQKAFAALPGPDRENVLLLSGILRLANALDTHHDGRVSSVEVETEANTVVVRAEGYTEEEPMASVLAEARHLLEVACRRPILVRALRDRATRS